MRAYPDLFRPQNKRGNSLAQLPNFGGGLAHAHFLSYMPWNFTAVKLLALHGDFKVLPYPSRPAEGGQHCPAQRKACQTIGQFIQCLRLGPLPI